MKKLSLATMYGAGLTGFAPGTCGSLVAALMAYGIMQLSFGWAWLTLGAIFFTLLGTRSANRYMREFNTAHDPSEIVIDELIGQWLTYSIWFTCLALMAGSRDTALDLIRDVGSSPLYLTAGFLLFRFFDILKPWPISAADRRIHGGFGVMFDDILAAIPAGIALYALYCFMPLLLGTIETNPS